MRDDDGGEWAEKVIVITIQNTIKELAKEKNELIKSSKCSLAYEVLKENKNAIMELS